MTPHGSFIVICRKCRGVYEVPSSKMYCQCDKPKRKKKAVRRKKTKK